ncbi:MAG: biotin transporter BioY [Eubacterium sp.]|nr:biotin transporter BioY [Eubacterium sp.]
MSESSTSGRTSEKIQVKDICLIGMFTALIVVCSQLSIPMPAGVPMTLQTFIIPLAGIVLGAKRGTIATCIYLLLGAVGLPVFAGFSGGIGILFGMTGGFLLSFPLMALCAGLGSRHDNKVKTAAGLIIGAVLNYLVGMIMFAALTDSSMGYAFTACVLPFIPTAIIKIVLAEVIGLQMKKLLRRAGVLSVPASAV